MLPFPYNSEKIKKETEQHWYILCPFHKDTEPSMTINKKGRWGLWWRCWACGVNGSPKDYVALTKQNPRTAIVFDESATVYPEIEVDWDRRLLCKLNKLPKEVIKLADLIGVSVLTIEKFDLGFYCPKYIPTYLIPMYNKKGKVCGIQRHWWEGEKHIKKPQLYSKHGIFKPNVWTYDINKPLFICEGLTDTAVMVDMGFQAIGRYNALHKLNKEIIKQISKFKKVVIVSDTDEVGKKGSLELALRLKGDTLVIFPDPHKDIREMFLSEGKDKTKNWIERQIK